MEDLLLLNGINVKSLALDNCENNGSNSRYNKNTNDNQHRNNGKISVHIINIQPTNQSILNLE